MRKVKSACAIGVRGLRKWRGNLRITLLAAYILIFILRYFIPVLKFSADVGYGVRPYLFPHFVTDLFFQTVVMLGAVMLFCDAPFMDDSSPYVIVRSGRYPWACGQVIYILLASTAYVLFIFLLSIVIVLPRIEFGETWGKVIGTLCATNKGYEYGIGWLSRGIFNVYTPAEAVGLSLLLTWLCTVFMGLTMFVLNFNIHKAVGPSVCCAMIGMNYFIWNFLPSYFYEWSPITLANLDMLNDPRQTDFLSTHYALTFYAVAICVLAVLAVFSVHKKTIQTINSD